MHKYKHKRSPIRAQPHTHITNPQIHEGREGGGRERERERAREGMKKRKARAHHVSGDLDLSETQYRPGGTGFLDKEIPSLESCVA
jgi:hypothetical protein